MTLNLDFRVKTMNLPVSVYFFKFVFLKDINYQIQCINVLRDI